MARIPWLMLVTSLVVGAGACDACDVGYSADLCEGIGCSGNGVCYEYNADALCFCYEGYAGDMCDECGEGYHDKGGACVVDMCKANSCSGHGTCDEISGKAVCTCDDGWAGTSCSIEWVAIPGGTFMMGSDSGQLDELPLHQVSVPAFEMNRTEVAVAQYQECVDDGVCTEPDDYTVNSCCNWGWIGREDYPVNCVDWFQAMDFCSRIGGRLPSEAEWEYAARGGGQDITYTWGDQSPTCEYAVMDDGGDGCGENRTWAVCSKMAGNTAQGLCDMAGNVWEWVQDWYHDDYNGAPLDGSAWETPNGSGRVSRGGSFSNDGDFLRAALRRDHDPSNRHGVLGLRCARDVP